MLHQVIAEHLEVFLHAVAEAGDGAGLPQFIEREFREFLTCGVFEHGVARFRCEGCAHEHLVPFSCKGRAAPGPAGVRVWAVMSRGWGPRTGRPLPEAIWSLNETRSNSQIPTPCPHRCPLNSHALTSVEGLVGQDEIDAAIQTTSTSKARRVDFGGCGPPQ